MHFGLTDKTALITGSTAGIGFAAALGFAHEGARVVLNGRSSDRVARAVAQLRAMLPDRPAGDISGIDADLSSAKGADKIIGSLPEVDILVNNVGTFGPKDFFDIPDAEWQHFFDLNVMSGVRLSRHYLRGMLERNWGRVIFISSESGVQIPAEMVHYGMTKTAQLAVSRGLAQLTAGTAVTVNAVLPGPTYSEGIAEFIAEMAAARGADPAAFETDFIKEARPTSLLQRPARVEEVANMIVYTGSEAASATNGAALRVDGGVVNSIL
ncbi:MAG: SDR family NAD(P)-dependent oxidoreductase [Alphaproteobacteria bacterium]|jgi:NAD(P)-dependent dehydrogenase (short-subunit alcohol dehydrogenase family)|nr:SDR family NAD(P)-dependent oxidoreductase [Alphaproteobacteria bacterium]